MTTATAALSNTDPARGGGTGTSTNNGGSSTPVTVPIHLSLAGPPTLGGPLARHDYRMAGSRRQN